MNHIPFNGTMSIAGRSAIITGAANGIGKATVEVFAKSGANIALVDMAPEVVQYSEHVGRKYNVAALAIQADLTAKGSAEEVAERTAGRFGKIDVLANVAGVGIVDYAIDLTEEAWDRTMLINAKVPFLLSQAVGKRMIAQGGGKIVCVASQGGVIATDRHIAYTASKAALIGMTKTLALEWAKYNINANLVSPTVVLTEMGEKIWQGAAADAMKAKIPCGRFCYPDEVAAAILFLSSDAANMINGENLLIDGGYTVQ